MNGKNVSLNVKVWVFLQNKACLLSELSTVCITTPLTLHFSGMQTQKHAHIHCHLY